MNNTVVVGSHWTFECVRAGKVIWTREYDNLVTTAGLNKLLDATFSGGLASPAWYVGLVNASPAFVAGDTMGSHAGWTENVSYSQTTREALVPGTIAAGSFNNSASKASFTINAATTVAGSFLSDSDTKSGTTGVLYSEVAFTGGTETLASADVLNVTVTLTVQSGASAGSSSGFMPVKEEVFGLYHP